MKKMIIKYQIVVILIKKVNKQIVINLIKLNL